ncbi:protein rep, partial [Staphylococcus saprophyticus]|uniref:protein rep n=1 Tax=Staphylococcus saprophyticus TaxID=29385 RepID=UPI001642BE78
PKPPSLFLTLSTKNPIHPHTLQQTFKHLTKPFHTLTTYKKLNQNLLPFFPSTQLTLNKNHPTYNQHIHLLLSLQNTYFNNKPNYITQQQSLNLSQKPLQLNYPPLPNIKPIKPNQKPHKHIQPPIKQTSKYSLNSSHFLTHHHQTNQQILNHLQKPLYPKPIFTYPR